MEQESKIKWNSCETGRLEHPIFPDTTDKLWFNELPVERMIITENEPHC
jgi:hypothetical protein